MLSDQILQWSAEHGVRIVLILLVGYLLHHFAGRITSNIVRKVVRQGHGTHEAEQKRENTLIAVSTGTAGVVITGVTLLMILAEFGVNIGPLLAAAGVAGIALGFGGQYLIRDVISGLFILLENQYRVGDVVCFDATCGSVEAITIRMTTLRDLDGTVHHVPHGEVKTVSNLTKQFARVNLNIGVSYASNLEHVIDVVNKVGNQMAEDEYWKPKIITPPLFLRVDDFGDSSIKIKILGDTQPLMQWEVAGELRKRLKFAFDAEGIEIPFPQRVIHTQREG